mgnify:CR=1 FL=1
MKIYFPFALFSLTGMITLLLYNYIFQEFLTLLNLHELTPFFSPSLLRKEGEDSEEQSIVTPSLRSREGGGGVSSWEKLFCLGPYHPILRDYLFPSISTASQSPQGICLLFQAHRKM